MRGLDYETKVRGCLGEVSVCLVRFGTVPWRRGPHPEGTDTTDTTGTDTTDRSGNEGADNTVNIDRT
jgi:hypothetical protein